MIGAVAGDIIGSIYERNPIKTEARTIQSCPWRWHRQFWVTEITVGK